MSKDLYFTPGHLPHFYALGIRAAKALTRLYICTALSVHWLFSYALFTSIACSCLTSLFAFTLNRLGCLQFVIVVFPDHTRLLFWGQLLGKVILIYEQFYTFHTDHFTPKHTAFGNSPAC